MDEKKSLFQIFTQRPDPAHLAILCSAIQAVSFAKCAPFNFDHQRVHQPPKSVLRRKPFFIHIYSTSLRLPHHELPHRNALACIFQRLMISIFFDAHAQTEGPNEPMILNGFTREQNQFGPCVEPCLNHYVRLVRIQQNPMIACKKSLPHH